MNWKKNLAILALCLIFLGNTACPIKEIYEEGF